MNTREQLQEILRQGWRPPDGLDRIRHREVQLTGGGWALVVTSAALVLAALPLGLFLYLQAEREQEEERVLWEQGADAEALVTRHWQTKGESRQRWIAYEFTAGGYTYSRRVKTPRRIWDTLREGSPIPVRYIAASPEINHPHGWRDETTPVAVAWLVGFGMAAVGGVILLPLLAQRRMVAEGRAAPGIVTGKKKVAHGYGASHTEISYDFLLLSGGVASGKCSGDSKMAPGTVITVLYDPDNPRSSARYPASLVRPRVRSRL
jgi:hypothetical protein